MEGQLIVILTALTILRGTGIRKSQDTIKNIAKEFSLPEEKVIEYVEKYW